MSEFVSVSLTEEARDVLKEEAARQTGVVRKTVSLSGAVKSLIKERDSLQGKYDLLKAKVGDDRKVAVSERIQEQLHEFFPNGDWQFEYSAEAGVTIDGALISLWQNNLLAVRAEKDDGDFLHVRTLVFHNITGDFYMEAPEKVLPQH